MIVLGVVLLCAWLLNPPYFAELNHPHGSCLES